MTPAKASRSKKRAPRNAQRSNEQSVGTKAKRSSGDKTRTDGRARKVAKYLGVTFVTALVGAAAAAGINLWLAPQQQIRLQQGLDQSQADSDAQSPDLIVQDIRSAGKQTGVSGYSEATEVDYSLAQVKQYASFNDPLVGNRFLPADPTKILIGHVTESPKGSLPLTYSLVNLTLVGNHYKPVRISAFTINILEKFKPPSGTLFLGGAEGDSPDTVMGFDLDDSIDPNGRNLTNSPSPVIAPGDYLDSHQITLQKNESISFLIVIFSRNGAYKYDFNAKTDDGHIQTIDNNGEPWAISSFTAAYRHAFRFNYRPTGPEIVECTPWSTCLSS